MWNSLVSEILERWVIERFNGCYVYWLVRFGVKYLLIFVELECEFIVLCSYCFFYKFCIGFIGVKVRLVCVNILS